MTALLGFIQGTGTAVAICCLAFSLNFVHVFVNKEYEGFHGDKNMIFVWAAFYAVCAGWIYQAAGEKPK